jgi:lysophospholipase L1-like esterase
MLRPRRPLALLAVLLLAGLLSACGSPQPKESEQAAASLRSIPANAAVYFFGDSWTQGFAATPGHGYAFVAAAALGWSPALGPNGSGSGYVHVNTSGGLTYPERAATLPDHITADVVVLQGSINDEQGDLTRLDQAFRTTVRLLRQKTDDAPIIVLGPAPASAPTSAKLRSIDGKLAKDAAALKLPYISPVKENWINSGNVASMIDKSLGHPGTVGHAYFGGRVASAIQQLLTTR